MKDTLSVTDITRDLDTAIIGREVVYYPRVSSTNRVALEAGRNGVVEGLVVVADEQTGGRGRRERVWLSPPGCLAVSFVLQPEVSELPSLVMLASLAVVRAVREVTGLTPQIKWPNDVIIDGKKICGILVENEIRGNRLTQAVIGIGVNVNNPTTALPEGLSLATSLAQETGMVVSRLELLRRLLLAADEMYRRLRAGGSVFEAWRDSLVTLGREVCVTSGGGELVGLAEAVDQDGSLWVRDAVGNRHRVIASEVTLRNRSGG